MALEEEELTVNEPKEVDICTPVCCLGYLSGINLVVALCVGMYVRWDVTSEPTILVIFILGLVVLGIASILHYYFSMKNASLSLFHLWVGFLLGLLCFLNSSSLTSNVIELVANYLLLASAIIKTMWALSERIFSSIRHKPTLLTSAELLELLGFGVASMCMLLNKSAAIMGLVVALGALIVDLRMKSLLALPNLASFALVTSLVFFQALGITANPYALGCYLGRLLCEPVLDVYFSALGPSERWMPVLSLGRVWRRLSLLPLSLIELAFFVLAALKVYSALLHTLTCPLCELQFVTLHATVCMNDDAPFCITLKSEVRLSLFSCLCTARPLGALVSGDSRLLSVCRFLDHLPRHLAVDHMGLPHQVE